MASKLGVRTTAILSLEETSRILRGKSIEEYYAFPRYPEGDSFRTAATGFEEIKDGPNVGPQKVLLNSPDYFGSIFPRDGGPNVRLERESTQWSKLVKETKLDDPNGYLKDCDGAGTKVETYRGTPEDFMAAHTGEFPKRTLTWNSIVHFASEGCVGKAEANISAGAQYRELTKLTKGVEADICDESTENLKSFIRAVAKKVIEELDLVYPLPAGSDPGKLTSIFNRTRSTELQPGKDYKVIDNSVVFTAESVGKDDDIELRFRK
jgi:hypothetical protein